jgi:hypothetical protein
MLHIIHPRISFSSLQSLFSLTVSLISRHISTPPLPLPVPLLTQKSGPGDKHSKRAASHYISMRERKKDNNPNPDQKDKRHRHVCVPNGMKEKYIFPMPLQLSNSVLSVLR